MRGRIFLCLLLAFIPAPALADDSPVGISWVQTKDLRLFYYDSLSYLVPHAVRTFTNSLEWQRRMFGWMPSEPTTVLLQDLSDYGGAHAYAAPRATLAIDPTGEDPRPAGKAVGVPTHPHLLRKWLNHRNRSRFTLGDLARSVSA